MSPQEAAIRARYPDPPPRPAAWAGWRRPRHQDAPWEHVQAADRPSKGDCLQQLLEVSELIGMEPVTWEYLLLPAGARPAQVAPGAGRTR